MKKSLISATAIGLALSVTSAFAADLPSRKAPAYIPPPPPPMWTGFYVGLNAGGTFAGSSSGYTNAGGLFDTEGGIDAFGAAASAANFVGGGNNGGFIGGGQVGYNWQFGAGSWGGGFGGLGGGAFVVGVEADIQGVATSGGTTNGAGAAINSENEIFTTLSQHHSNLDYLGTVRGRLGYLVTPTLLVYGTGGLAYGGVSTSASHFTLETFAGGGIEAAGGGAAAFSDTRVGWTAGGGVEWMFMPNWSAKLEYLYYDLGTVSDNGVLVADGLNAPADWAYVAASHKRFDGHIVRASVNYHFNWGAPAPVLAKF